MIRRRPWLVVTFALALFFALFLVIGAKQPHSHPAPLFPGALDAIAWYDTLGFPDVQHLPYVRVTTGRSIQFGNQTPQNRFTEGFLVSEEPGAFTVFICSVPKPEDRLGLDDPCPPLTTIRFVRHTSGPAYQRVDYEALNFKKVAGETSDRMRTRIEPSDGYLRGRHTVLFAFARACLQKGLSDIGAELMKRTQKIPGPETGIPDSQLLRGWLQMEIGDAVLAQAPRDFIDPKASWADLLKIYDGFDTRYPANTHVAETRESVALLQQIVAEEAAHHPKPLEQMSPTEQVAENIYQLRNLGYRTWGLGGRYPLDARTRADQEVITPVHRLVDLGTVAVPQLIEALDDRRFTRMWETIANTVTSPDPPPIPRVGDIAQRILEFMAGRNFYGRVTEDGQPAGPTTRQLAEAWWTEVQGHGEKEALKKESFEDPRICDMAALVLSQCWPEKYPFHWAKSATECDAHIAKMRALACGAG